MQVTTSAGTVSPNAPTRCPARGRLPSWPGTTRLMPNGPASPPRPPREHAAEYALPWAVNALGPVPAHPLERLDWQRRASSIGAYRELFGYDHPVECHDAAANAREMARRTFG